MKAILEFDLSDPHERESFELCKDGERLKWRIDEFDNWLRGLIKHHERETHPTLEEVREKLWEVLKDE